MENLLEKENVKRVSEFLKKFKDNNFIKNNNKGYYI